ncbi:MAG: hypothetical protein ASARMPRED_001947 [Alectoria sarmentosa]|nr:MAG: hypothetical protein ASARMPRED_001947 [Alectoria sarmentosa]
MESRPELEHLEGFDQLVEKRGFVNIENPMEVHNLESPGAREAERKYIWKLDLIILPTISALYFSEYIDRGNIANAKLYGLDDGHDTVKQGVGPGKNSLTSPQWQLSIMIFYIGLILFQWIAFGVCMWCVASSLQDVALSQSGLLACRFFIGTFEGLFGTGIVYYLSLWYHRYELGLRVFSFLGPTAVAGAFGGLIAYGVGHIKTSTPNWKWLFLVEAVPGFVIGLFCLYWLPDRPTKNSRFKGAQQEIAIARYYRESFDKDGPIQWKHVRMTITDWRLYMQAAIYLTTAACLASISGFLPTIVQDLGYKSATSANLMTVPPYAVAFVLMFIISYSSDRCRDRGLHITGLMIVAAIAYVLLATLPQSQLHGKYACVCIAVACVYATYPPTHAWAANNFGNGTKRAIGLGMYTAIGNCGSVAGTYFYPSTEAPQFHKGHYLCFAMSLATAVLAFTNHWVLGRINKARDERCGKVREGESVDVSEMADESLGFRFIT